MKGIILAGGKGTRLYPMTKVVSKHLLPVYDKPMIYYPLSVLLLAGIRDILLITTPMDIDLFRRLLSDGSQLGVNISYMVQEKPRGVAEAFILGEKFIGSDSVCLILGDNVFYGQTLTLLLSQAKQRKQGATVFSYRVKNPSQFSVIETGDDSEVLSIEEKPDAPKSNYAVPGLYFYDNNVVSIAKSIVPSARGELEISAVNATYLSYGQLHVIALGRGMAWLDTGTPEGLLRAAEYVEAVQSRQGFYISCPEEIAWRKGYISTTRLQSIGGELGATDYGQYLLSLVKGGIQ